PGSPFHSVHFVPDATCWAALMASHSVGATTPTRFPFTTTCAFGKRVLSRAPTEVSLEPSVLGWTMRACSIPGRRTSVTQVSFAVTFGTVTELGNDLPMIVYWLTGLSGGFPSIVNPNMLWMSPLTGIVRFNFWPLTRSPYDTLLPPP